MTQYDRQPSLLESDQTGYPSYRWFILLLVFLATTINYADRIILSVASKAVCDELALDEVKYGYILTAFTLLYTVGFVFAGSIIDRLGTRLGYLLSIVTWSLAGMLTGLSRSVWSLGFWRGALGLTESGNFPAAIKAVAEWFHPRERALATSLFNSGPHISLVAGPPLIALLTLAVGWRWTFVIFGACGLVLALFWLMMYRHPYHLASEVGPSSQPDLSAGSGSSVRWRDLLKDRRVWAIVIGKFCADPVWWFYIFWLPKFLYDRHGFDIKGIGFAMPVIYGVAILLSNLAGWYAGWLMGRGVPDFRARKRVMLLCALCLPITALSGFTSHPWLVIVLVSLAAGAHSGWSANIFTLASDCFPASAVASVTGLGGFAGGLGGIIFSSLAPGFIVKYFGYVPIFILMGFLHPLAIFCIHLLIKEKPSSATIEKV